MNGLFDQSGCKCNLKIIKKYRLMSCFKSLFRPTSHDFVKKSLTLMKQSFTLIVYSIKSIK